jgi:hypothetical protein
VQRSAVPHQGEQVGTDVVGAGLDDGEGDRRRDRGVDGGSPFPQHRQAGLGGEGLAGRDYASRGVYG